MKKRLPLVAFAITILIIAVGFIAYHKYIKSKMDNITIQTIEIDCNNNPQQVLLIKHPDQSGIFQLELSIDGKASKKLNFQIGPNENLVTSDIRIKGGDIETAYINDWYTDSAFLKIDSENNTVGKLTISYQFIGIDSE